MLKDVETKRPEDRVVGGISGLEDKVCPIGGNFSPPAGGKTSVMCQYAMFARVS
jgi:hypothetical protein